MRMMTVAAASAPSFSALQRAENSSIPRGRRASAQARAFQCSSASRKFLNFVPDRTRRVRVRVSVLFSEPKIPQSALAVRVWNAHGGFSALQRAENSSMQSFGERGDVFGNGFSALQRAENSSILPEPTLVVHTGKFQCSSASRKFLNRDPRTCVHPYSRLRRSRFVVPEPSWCVAMTPVY